MAKTSACRPVSRLLTSTEWTLNTASSPQVLTATFGESAAYVVVVVVASAVDKIELISMNCASPRLLAYS